MHLYALLYVILFEGFPFVTVYLEDITCADGFYLLNPIYNISRGDILHLSYTVQSYAKPVV